MGRGDGGEGREEGSGGAGARLESGDEVLMRAPQSPREDRPEGPVNSKVAFLTSLSCLCQTHFLTLQDLSAAQC